MSTRGSRRDFNKAVTALAASSLAAGSPCVFADEPVDPLAAPTQAMFDIVRARYGKHLSEEQLKRLRQKIRQEQRDAARLRSLRLNNSDEPAFVYSADVG
jgi:hypothetical protein